MNPVGIGALAVLSIASGCSLDYSKDATPSPDQIPLMVFHNLRETGVKDGKLSYTMETAQSESYPGLKQVRLKNFQFQEYDASGREASEGEADAATIDTASDDAKITGRLTARSDEQKVTLSVGGTSGGLTWDNDDRLLKTAPDTPVLLTKDDGSKIEAQSLVLDLGSKRLDLGGGVSGTWTPEEHHHAEPLDSPDTPGSAQRPGGR